MDVDDDEYMNAAASHAAYVMTVSAASMYWLCHAQHARDKNIHKLHPLPEKKIGLGRSADFLHSGTPLLDTHTDIYWRSCGLDAE